MRFASTLFLDLFSARLRLLVLFALLAAVASLLAGAAQAQPAAPAAKTPPAPPPPDTLVFANGDRLSGTFIRSAGPGIVFRSAMLGEIQVGWANIKELETKGAMVVIPKEVLAHRGNPTLALPSGPITVADQLVTLHPENGASIPPTPVKNVEFIVDQNLFRKEIVGHPRFLEGWNGALTAGTTLVHSTQDQYTITGAVNLTRIVPTVSWLTPRNRTLFNFTDAAGKVTQPAFTVSGVTVPAASVKIDIFHFDAERDESLKPRFYLLAKTVLDHNYAQDLNLQESYGGGIGWVALKRSTQGLYLDAMLQYEGQNFLNAAASANKKLIASTLDATWGAVLSHGILAKQIVYWIPAFNNTHAYSVGESNSLTLPFYKGLAFSVSSVDDYLDDPPPEIPPIKRNSFELTTGISFTIKSKY